MKQIKQGVYLWEEYLTGERPFLDAVRFPTYIVQTVFSHHLGKRFDDQIAMVNILSIKSFFIFVVFFLKKAYDSFVDKSTKGENHNDSI